MYHLYQYEYDTSSATCKYKNINMLEDCCTIGHIQCPESNSLQYQVLQGVIKKFCNLAIKR